MYTDKQNSVVAHEKGGFMRTWLSKSTLIILLLVFASCKKMIEVPAPAQSINSANIFASDATAVGAVNALYLNSKVNDLFLRAGLLADELTLYSPTYFDYQVYYKNDLLSTTSSLPWNNLYSQIFRCNRALEGLSASSTLTPGVKQQLVGEAMFMRAFCYFHLVNLFGDVPLALTTDPEVNRLLSRSSQDEVYTQIINDLKQAKIRLSKNFLDVTLQSSTPERVRPTYWAATALLARAYLFNKQFQKAVEEATDVINNNATISLVDLNQVFLKNSSETIWAIQSQPNSQPYNAPEGAIFVLPSSGPGVDLSTQVSYPVYLSRHIVNSFEVGDARRTSWIDSVIVTSTNPVRKDTFHYSYKYKAGFKQTAVTEYTIVFRLGEQFLIRAEAKARLNDIAGAVADLNVIRSRARAMPSITVPNPLPNLSTNLSTSQLYVAIEQERKVELFTEWGHRWFDLKRTPGFNDPAKVRADEVMPSIAAEKGGTWNPNWKLMPIPREQILKDPNMANAQNPGYQ